jgi:pectinesterase
MAMDATTPLVEEQGNARHESCAQRRCLGGIVVCIGTLAMVIVLLLAGSDIGRPESPLDVACGATFYPETCKKTLLGNCRASPEELTRRVVSSAALGVAKMLTTVLESRGGKRVGLSSSGKSVCRQTLESSIEQLKASLAALESDVSPYPFEELKMRLSAAMEFHTTCIDTLMETGALDRRTVDQKQHTEELLSNTLAFINALSRFGSDVRTWKRTAGAPNPSSNGAKNSRKFLNPVPATVPSWMSGEHLALLIEADPPVDVVVAKDGSGKFKSIQAAVDAAPKSGSATAKRYVIRIKPGVYDEQVTVPKQATNFMFIGDGAASSIITGDRSVAKTPGMTTFLSASLSKQPQSASHIELFQTDCNSASDLKTRWILCCSC